MEEPAFVEPEISTPDLTPAQVEPVLQAVHVEAAIDAVPAEAVFEPLGAGTTAVDAGDLSLVLDVPVELAVEVGRTTMTIRETLALAPGSIIALNRMAGEPVDLLVNGRRIARGEVVAVDEEFGLRVTEVIATPISGDLREISL